MDTLLLYIVAELAGKASGEGAAAARVGEDVDAGEGHLFAEGVALIKLSFGFAWEAGDHVGGNCYAGNALAQTADSLAVLLRRVAAAHPAKDALAAALERKVEVAAKAFVVPQLD